MEIDFDFIKKVGDEVRTLFLNDPDTSDWFYNAIEEYNENNSSDLVTIVIDKINLVDNEYNKKIANDVLAIAQDDDNIENLLSFIFYPVSNGEEEEEEADDIPSKSLSLEINSKTDDDDDDDDDDDMSKIGPEAYFDKIIKKIMKILGISHDISYVLCKKFNLSSDVICQQWFSSQDEILKSLRIKIGSDMVPTAKSPLTIKSIGVDECPICAEDCEVFQLYCGHKLCKDCLISEIKTLISENQIPVCRQQYEEEEGHNLCNSEILINDVKNFLNDDKLFEKYKKILLDKETSVYQGVRRCPNEYCDAVITPVNEIQCHVGRCSQCRGFVCLKCRQDCHAPIIDCTKVDHFFVTLADSMKELKESQNKWIKREKKLAVYRHNHKKEFHSAYNVIIQQLKTKYRELNRKEVQQMDEIESILKELQKKIVCLRKRKINEINTKAERISIDFELKELQSEYSKNEVVLKRLQAESQNNQDNLIKELEFYENEEKLLDKCYSSSADSELNFLKFDIAMNDHAISRIKFLSQDWIQNSLLKQQTEKTSEVVITGIFKKCPDCKTPIERISGCNHMICSICGCQFCYICGDYWSKHIGYICPKYELKSNTENAAKQKKKSKKGPKLEKENNFFMPPMSVEKRVDYFRWNNSYSQFQVQKEKYDDVFHDFKNKKNLKLEPGEFFYSDKKLCTRNKIAKVLLKDVDRSEVKMKTYSIMNEILFAKSIVMWGYPALYYMMHNPHKAMLFEYKLLLLEEAADKFIDLLHNPGDSSSKDFDTNVEIIDRQIIDILSIAEVF